MEAIIGATIEPTSKIDQTLTTTFLVDDSIVFFSSFHKYMEEKMKPIFKKIIK